MEKGVSACFICIEANIRIRSQAPKAIVLALALGICFICELLFRANTLASRRHVEPTVIDI